LHLGVLALTSPARPAVEPSGTLPNPAEDRRRRWGVVRTARMTLLMIKWSSESGGCLSKALEGRPNPAEDQKRRGKAFRRWRKGGLNVERQSFIVYQ